MYYAKVLAEALNKDGNLGLTLLLRPCAFRAAPASGSAFSNSHRGILQSGNSSKLMSPNGDPWHYLGYRYSLLACMSVLVCLFLV